MTAYENDPLIGTGAPFPVTAAYSLKLMTRSCREPASPPFLPATPFVSAFVQGTFVPSAIAASVRGTLLPPSGTFAFASARSTDSSSARTLTRRGRGRVSLLRPPF